MLACRLPKSRRVQLGQCRLQWCVGDLDVVGQNLSQQMETER